MSEYKEALRQNISKLYILKACMGAFLVVPIIILFLQEQGLSLQEVFILQGTFAFALVLLEIPSGYLSDRWGRRNTCILGGLSYFFAVLIYSLGSSFWGFFFAEIILAAGVSFYSGTIEALTYDSLLELEEEKTYRSVNGQQAFNHFGAEALGSVVGGLLAVVSLRATFWATLIPFGATVLISLSLTEPRRHKLQEERHLEAMWKIIKQTVHMSALRSIILLHAFISLLTMSLFWLTQPWQLDVGLPLALFGVTHAVIVAAGAVASKYTHSFERWVDDRLFLVCIALAVLVSYLCLGLTSTLWGLSFFLLTRIAWGFLSPLTSDLVNRMTTSDIRATVLSLKGFVGRLTFAVFSPLFGYVADIYTLQQAFMMICVLGTVIIGATFFLMKSVWKEIPK